MCTRHNEQHEEWGHNKDITQWRKKGEKEKQEKKKKSLNTSVNLTIKSTVQLFREKVQTMQRMHSI